MIISASRRTDIPAFYGQWFMNRVRAGFCEVPHPFNPRQVSRISLARRDVDFIVFWTRFPASLRPHLDELSDRGYPFHVQFTLLDYPEDFERFLPPFEARLELFRELSERLGPGRVLWRYDPVILTDRTDAAFHEDTFSRIAGALRGKTQEVTVSSLDMYAGIRGRMKGLEPREEPDIGLFRKLASAAAANGMDIRSCAKPALSAAGIRSGACIDAARARRLFGTEAAAGKDPGQRADCLCTVSRDIGVYNTCRFGCRYCYATRDSSAARGGVSRHDPDSPSLSG